VCLSFRFAVSHRDVEDLLAERGVRVSYEAIRLWCLKFGRTLGAGLRRRRRRAADTGHLDEVQPKIRGKRHCLWRAVDQVGTVLDIPVQERRNKAAAEIFLRRAVAGVGTRPRVLVTDELASSRPAQRRGLPGVGHRRPKGLNDRAENAPRPPRRRERAVQRCQAPVPAQRVRSAFEPIPGHVCPRRHRLPASRCRAVLAARFSAWRQVGGLAA
jgi:putative transposase